MGGFEVALLNNAMTKIDMNIKTLFLITLFFIPLSHVHADNRQCLNYDPEKAPAIIRAFYGARDLVVAGAKKSTAAVANKAGELVTAGANNVFSEDTIEFFDKSNTVITKQALHTGHKSKITFYKFVRDHGVSIKIKSPIDMDTIQDFLSSVFDINSVELPVNFKAEYVIKIRPNDKTGDIYRDDSLVFTPELTHSEMVNSFNVSGRLSTSYIYTLSRQYVGYATPEEDAKTDEEYVASLREVFKTTPFFFRPRCQQNETQYIVNLPDNIMIPNTFDKLDNQLLINDTLTYQKKSILGLSAGISKVNSYSQLRASINKGRVVTINKIVNKKLYQGKPVYHMKAFLDSTDTVLETEISAKMGMMDGKIVSWKALDKALKKPLREELLNIRMSKKEKLVYLTSFYFSLADPHYQKFNEHLNDIRDAYDNLIANYFIPSWHHIKTSAEILFQIGDHEARKEFLDKRLREIISPLTELAEVSKGIADDQGFQYQGDHKDYSHLYKAKPGFIKTPTCDVIRLDPLTQYLSVIKDVVEEVFSFEVNFIKAAKVKYKKSWRDEFYEIRNQSDQFEYYLQSILDTNLSRKYPQLVKKLFDFKNTRLFEKRDSDRQFFALTRTAKNKGIYEFYTLGQSFSFSDLSLSKAESNRFKNEVKKVIPRGHKNEEILKKYKELEPKFLKGQAYVGYKAMLSSEGFKMISQRVTEEFKKHRNFDFMKKIVNNCMTKKDPNFEDKIPCTGHLSYYRSYFDAKRFGNKKNSSDASLDPYEDVEKIEDSMESIAIKLTLIFLETETEEEYYNYIDEMTPKVRVLFYKRNWGGNITKKKRYGSVNNAKYVLFNSLISNGYSSKGVIVDGEERYFKDISPVIVPYVLYYTFYKSDPYRQVINPYVFNHIDKYLYFFAIFRSNRLNLERVVFPGSKIVGGEKEFDPTSIMDFKTLTLLREINFFNFNFDNVRIMEINCDNNSEQRKVIETYGTEK